MVCSRRFSLWLDIAVFLRLVRGRAAGLRSVTGWDTYLCIAKFLAQLMYLTSHYSLQKKCKNENKKKKVKSIAFRFLQSARDCHWF